LVHGGPDYLKRISVVDAFGYRDKIPTYEVAPWTIRYQAAPADLTEGDYASALADIKGRPIVNAILDAASATINVDVTDEWTRQLGQADLARVLGAALSKTNPIFSRLTDGTDTYDAAKTGQLPTALDTGALKVKEQSPISGFATSVNQIVLGGYVDGIETLLGGGLPAALDTGALKVREQNPLTSISVSDFPADYPDSAVATKLAGGLPAALDTGALKIREQNWPTDYDVKDRAARLLGEVDNLKKWGGTALTGRDISLDFKVLTDTMDTALFNAMVARSESEVALGAGKLFGAGLAFVATSTKLPVVNLNNPNASGKTIRVKQLTLYCNLANSFFLYFDQAPTNMGATTAGLNLKRGGSAASGTTQQSLDGGAAPAFTSSIACVTVSAGGSLVIPVNIQIDANHTLNIWATAPSSSISVGLQWEEY
jgi:hypothetical protein